jgi:hypothetical protein
VAEGNHTKERPEQSVRAAFIVSPARSGSTLLRVLLDTHPDIVSPPELNLSALLQHMADSWDNTNVALGLAEPRENPMLSRTPTEDVAHRARKPLDEMMRTCAEAAGASLYVDKSLTTVEHLPTIAACYPEAPLIFLYRYPLDFIASGLEASRWGFNAFGFVPYVAANPGNFIAALGGYWIDRVSQMLEFERTFEGSSARIYYELLCDQPRDTLKNLFDFLGVDADESVVERAFESEHGRGPGDYKIAFTGGISLDSVGRGATLPEHLGKEQIERMNALLAELDYPELEAARRGQLASLLGLQNARDSAQEGREIARAMADLLERDGRGAPSPAQRAALPMELVVARAARGEPGRVLIDADGRATALEQTVDGETSGRPQIRCIGDILLRVAGGEVTFGKAVHDGEIRVERETLSDTGAPAHRLLSTLAALIRVSA